jgi:nitric oxide dioxygenase
MTGVEVATMSTSSVDPIHYYPSYVNPHPALTLEQFRLIQQAWKRVKDGQVEAYQAQTVVADPLGWWGLQFYDTLFALNPALKPLFKNTFTQSKMLTEMVDAALGLLPGVLDQVLGAEKTAIDPQLIPILVDLAERHVAYNVKAEYYGTVGLALVTTLERTLGNRVDAQTKAAWIELWSLICTVMIPAHVQHAQAMGVEV